MNTEISNQQLKLQGLNQYRMFTIFTIQRWEVDNE